MSDLTINTTMQTTASMHRNNAGSQASASTPAPQATNVIKAGEFTQMKGTINSDSMYVVQFRDSESGEVQMQYPSKTAATAYQKTATVVEAKSDSPAPAPTTSPAPSTHEGGDKVASIGSGSEQSS